jgi:hypothetical protein
MDNLNTNQITLGNMGSVDIEQPRPDESREANVDVAQEAPQESKKPEEDVEDDKPSSDQTMLIFGGLLALLFLFRKKL